MPLSRLVKLSYAASYAAQSDYHRNPSNYSADYYLLEALLWLEANSAKKGEI